MIQHARSITFSKHRDPRLEESSGIAAPSAAPRPEDYPELPPELQAIFEEDWLQDPRGLEALHYLAR